MKNKRGIVIIAEYFIRDMAIYKEQLSLLFANFFPIRVDADFEGFKYFGYSDLFDEVKEGEIPHTYDAVFTYSEETDGYTLSFKRL